MIGWARWALTIVAALAPTFWARSAAAELAELSWSAPRACPQSAYVAERVRSSLREARALRSDLRVRARVRRAARARYVLELSLTAVDYRAERRLASNNCKSLADAAAWLIAEALDPNLSDTNVNDASEATRTAPASARSESAANESATSERAAIVGTGPRADAGPSGAAANGAQDVASPSVEGGSSAGIVASAKPGMRREEPVEAVRGQPQAQPTRTFSPTGRTLPQAAESAPAHAERPPRWWRAGLFGGSWYAKLPSVQASFGARAGLGIGHFYSELSGAWMPARAIQRADVKARVATQAVAIATCAVWGAALRGGPCATVALQRTAGELRDAMLATDRALLWGSSGLAVQLGWKRSWLEIMAEAGVSAPVSARPRFTVQGVGEVVRALPATVYARLGLGVRSADMTRAK